MLDPPPTLCFFVCEDFRSVHWYISWVALNHAPTAFTCRACPGVTALGDGGGGVEPDEPDSCNRRPDASDAQSHTIEDALSGHWSGEGGEGEAAGEEGGGAVPG